MTIGPSGHPGLDQLDELLDQGIDASSGLGSHVEQCPQCSRELDSLSQVRTVLAAARSDVPMPDSLADRIQTALLTEAGYRVAGGVPRHENLHFDDAPPVFDVLLPVGIAEAQSAETRGSAAVAPGLANTVTPLRRRRSPLLWLGAAAAAVLAVGVGGGVISSQLAQPPTANTALEGAAQDQSVADDAEGSAPAGLSTQAELQRESAAGPGAGLGDLDQQSLPEAVRSQTATGAVAPAEPNRSCSDKLGLDPATPSYPAQWNGADAIVYVTSGTDGEQVNVVDAECRAGVAGGFRYDTTVRR